jgi:hypothetical protein
MKKIIVMIVIITVYSCKSTGTYYWNGNTSSDKNHLVLDVDSTFSYNWSNHIAGNFKIEGKWKEINNILYLKENYLKFKNNKLKDLGLGKRRYISVVNSDKIPMSALKLVINNNDKFLTTDFDGYCYLTTEVLNSIKVYDADTNYFLGEFDLNNSTLKSYELMIDYKTISKSFCNDCPFELKRKGNKLYPLKNNKIDKEYFFKKDIE